MWYSTFVVYVRLCAGNIVYLQIVQRYDILLIQEIRDKSETAIETLIDAVNDDVG